MAERVNGILKDEFYLDQTFDNIAHAKRAAKNAINLYNEVREDELTIICFEENQATLTSDEMGI